MKFRTGLEEDLNLAESQRTALTCEDESLTVQSDAAETDINTIVKRFGITGQMPEFIPWPETDVSHITDYAGALAYVRESETAFMKLPGEVRAKFNNDAGQFLDFAEDPKNVPALIEMGLGKALPKAAQPVTDAKEPAKVPSTT